MDSPIIRGTMQSRADMHTLCKMSMLRVKDCITRAVNENSNTWLIEGLTKADQAVLRINMLGDSCESASRGYVSNPRFRKTMANTYMDCEKIIGEIYEVRESISADLDNPAVWSGILKRWTDLYLRVSQLQLASPIPEVVE